MQNRHSNAADAEPLVTGQVLAMKTRLHGLREFRVVRPWIEGGKGITYLAKDIESGRAVIIKAGKAKAKNLEAEIEYRVLSEINHDNIVDLLGSFVDPHGRRFLCYEFLFPNALLYINNPKCRKAIQSPERYRSGRYVSLPMTVAADLSFELLQAVEKFHSFGFVHHDIKLANFLIRFEHDSHEITPELYWKKLSDGQFRGVLIDAGSVRNTDYLDKLNTTLDKTGPAVTPLLAPPEILIDTRQANGRVGRYFSPSVDLYQTALVIYVLFTGHTPYSHLKDRPQILTLDYILNIKRSEMNNAVFPIDLSTIMNCNMHADVTFLGQGREFSQFAKDFYQMLANRLQPNVKKRGTIRQFKDDFERLFGMKLRQVLRRRASSTARILKRNKKLQSPFTQTVLEMNGVNRLAQLLNAPPTEVQSSEDPEHRFRTRTGRF
ncbi:MAG: protein kinase, partial [Planctomycetota bacterium]|nr:protein kinase [Planctomycetota bacterium]